LTFLNFDRKIEVHFDKELNKTSV